MVRPAWFGPTYPAVPETQHIAVFRDVRPERPFASVSVHRRDD